MPNILGIDLTLNLHHHHHHHQHDSDFDINIGFLWIIPYLMPNNVLESIPNNPVLNHQPKRLWHGLAAKSGMTPQDMAMLLVPFRVSRGFMVNQQHDQWVDHGRSSLMKIRCFPWILPVFL